MTANSCCRLCGGQLLYRFNLTVLGKYEVAYFECHNCLSLQTEEPFWLSEAYDNNLSNLDTGAAQRVLRNLSVCYTVAKFFGVNNAIDIGGGDGLLCRFLRDFGINCFVKDKYADPAYAQGFTVPNFGVPDLVFAFEVIEHFQDPKAELDALFRINSDLLLFSTCVYTNEQHDWWYLSPESGQHVFFYSRKALDWIADRYGCKLIVSGNIILFARHGLHSLTRSILMKLLLNKYTSRIVRSLIVILPTPGVWQDHLLQKAKSGETAPLS